MISWVYPVLLLSSVAFVLWKGRFEERLIMATLMIGSVMTYFLYHWTSESWLNPSVALLVNEAAVTAVILFVAYRSKEFWPLPIAAFQMIALLTPLTNLLGENLASYALGVTQGIWAYPQLIILMVMTWRHLRKPRTAMTK